MQLNYLAKPLTMSQLWINTKDSSVGFWNTSVQPGALYQVWILSGELLPFLNLMLVTHSKNYQLFI